MEKKQVRIAEKWFDVLCTYHDQESNKDFIFYTDFGRDEAGKLIIGYGLYKEVNQKLEIKPLDNNHDKELAVKIMNEVLKEINEERK